MRQILWLSCVSFIIVSFVTGIVAQLFHLIEADFVNPEYFSGILGASSILFGLWAIVLQQKPKEEDKRLFDYYLVFFFISLFHLIESVIGIALTAVNLFSPTFALYIGTSSFCFNALMLGFSIYSKLKNAIE